MAIIEAIVVREFLLLNVGTVKDEVLEEGNTSLLGQSLVVALGGRGEEVGGRRLVGGKRSLRRHFILLYFGKLVTLLD